MKTKLIVSRFYGQLIATKRYFLRGSSAVESALSKEEMSGVDGFWKKIHATCRN